MTLERIHRSMCLGELGSGSGLDQCTSSCLINTRRRDLTHPPACDPAGCGGAGELW